MAAQRTPSPEDLLDIRQVGDAQIHPGGELVAFVMGDQFVVDTKLPRSNVWVVPAEGGEPRQYTHGPLADTTPRWSPDGETLAFLSDRVEEGQRQVYLMPSGGGEAGRLTQVTGAIPGPRGLNPMSWSPDGSKIAFLKTDPETEDEKRRREEKRDVIEFERSPKYTRLYLVDVATREVSCVSPAGLQIWEFSWAPSGRQVAVVTSDLPFEHSWYRCRLAAFPLDGGPARTLCQTGRQVAKPTWSPDGLQIAFISSAWSDRGSVAGGLFVVAAEGGEARELSAGHVASATWMEWAGDGTHLVTAAREEGGVGLADVQVDSGQRRPLWSGEVNFAETSWPQFSRDGAGRIAVVREDDSHPRDVWLASRRGDGLEWRQLTDLHLQAKELELAAVETVHWKGADGWEMQGLLVRPRQVPSGARPPMVTIVHGGPTSAHAHAYGGGRGWPQLLAAQGMAVFLPNPRGSTGWGLDFAESNIGDMGGKDWEDIKTGVEYCVEQGLADRERLGIAGWSYGGFMTAWAITQTDTFKAAMMGAGISDWRSFHGKSYLCDWDSIYYGDADPWDPDGPFRGFSPINFVKRARTPTLILHGEEDQDVPVEQSYLFHRALTDLNVPVELVVYPREAHGPEERGHVLDIARRISEWFARHLEP